MTHLMASNTMSAQFLQITHERHIWIQAHSSKGIQKREPLLFRTNKTAGSTQRLSALCGVFQSWGNMVPGGGIANAHMALF
jgi:hypothetical protein